MRQILALLCALAPGAALATGEIDCRAPDDSAGFSGLIGSVPGLALIGFRIDAGDDVWQMTSGSGQDIPDAQPMRLVQGATEAGRTVIDFADPNFERIIASIRLVTTSTDEGFAEAGTLAMPGIGVWPVVCAY